MYHRMFVWLTVVMPQLALAQTYTETITKELAFEKKSPANALIVTNLNGSVRVTGYPGDKVLVEVIKTVEAKTDDRLAKGKQEVRVGIVDRADTLILHVQDRCHEFGKGSGKGKDRDGKMWGYQYPGEHSCHLPYDYKMDFTVKVPYSLHVVVSTVNRGDVRVDGLEGEAHASNVNGGISLTRMSGPASAHTVNGNVDVEFTKNPQKACSFYSLNGDINAVFPGQLSASIGFESFNGNLYTNLRDMRKSPIKVEKSERGEGIRYVIKGTNYQVGSGGPDLGFETFNGDVYVRVK